MARLNLVIGDFNESFVGSLSAYINSCHSTTFQVSSFTRIEPFTDYVKGHPDIDILLISPEFFEVSKEYAGSRLKVLLSTGTLNRQYSDMKVVSKYNTGEKLLNEVMHLYSKIDCSEIRVMTCFKQAGIVGVYSSAGGTGKTTIATALSLQSAELGMKAFYLNLEHLQSTGLYFGMGGKRNLSYIFYYLKEKADNLSFRMEGIKCCDADLGIDYFNPPESPLEYEEISAEELAQLIQGIKEMGCYDFIFIDMSNSFDIKNYKLMTLCDRIVLVTLDEPTSMHKDRMLFYELDKLSPAGTGSISDKFIRVVNRCRSREGSFGENGADAAVRVPEFNKALIREDGRFAIDDDGFREAIGLLLQLVSEK